MKLIQAANNLEKEQKHNVQKLVIGAINHAKFIASHEGDYLEVKLLSDVKRLDCAVPTQVTTLIHSGFGVINAIGLLHVLLDGQIKLIENATWYAQRQIDPDFGRRKDLIDVRNIRFDCVSEYDYEEPCGIDDDATTDEDTTEEEDISEDDGLGTLGDEDGEDDQ